MERYVGKEEESVQKELKVLGLLPGRKIFFGPRLIYFATHVALKVYNISLVALLSP